MKKILIGAGIIIILAAVLVFTKKTPETTSTAFDGRNTTFTIDGTPVTLINGMAQVPAAPGSTSTVTTHYFGNEATGDLSLDGQDDIAFLVTQDAGGSGTFFYVVAAIKTETGYKTTNAFLVGDRIAPQSTNIISNELHVNFAMRNPGEPMTAKPTRGATLLLKVTPAGVLEGLMK